jgi:uncharacterized Zn finger protein
MDYFYYGWKPYVSAAARRAQAARALSKLRKDGRVLAPVQIAGRTIAATFWGKAWCRNLECYSDFANRLPRGRTYLRNGSVLDLQIARGTVTALVSGSAVYTTRIDVTAVAKARWRDICRDCTGAIDSLVDLLRGELSTGVIARLCEPNAGLFPAPKEVSFTCSCPDGAWMCKHVAAVLYGVGARLDTRPELLFLLRGVDQEDLIATAGAGLRVAAEQGERGRVIEGGDLSQLFDIEIAAPEPVLVPKAARGTQAPAARDEPASPRSARRSSPTAAAAARAAAGASGPPKTSGARGWSAAKRKAVSERMKKYWAKRRAAEARTAASAAKTSGVRGWSAASRKAVSERMKKYWAKRRAAAARTEATSAARKRPPRSAAQAKAPARAARGTKPPRGAAKDSPAVGSESWRREVSERMKRYWAERRRRFGR